MSRYFDEALALSKAAHHRALANGFAEAIAKASQGGRIFSGSTVARHRAVVGETVSKFADDVIRKLVEFDAEHSPIDPKDFETARTAIVSFKDEAEDACRTALRRFEKRLPAGLVDEAFDDGISAVNSALSRLEGRRLEYRSRRSFWKWAWGDLQKRIWTGFLLLAGMAVMATVSHLWALFTTK